MRTSAFSSAVLTTITRLSPAVLGDDLSMVQSLGSVIASPSLTMSPAVPSSSLAVSDNVTKTASEQGLNQHQSEPGQSAVNGLLQALSLGAGPKADELDSDSGSNSGLGDHGFRTDSLLGMAWVDGSDDYNISMDISGCICRSPLVFNGPLSAQSCPRI